MDGTLANPVNPTETGATIANGEVWTHASAAAVKYGGSGCSGFTSNSGSETGAVGRTGSKGGNWSVAYLQWCNRTNVRLYCFEQ